MISKEEQKKLSKLLVLTSLLLDEIDDVSVNPTPLLNDMHEKTKALNDVLEVALDKFYTNESLRKSTLVNTMSEKFEFNFKKLYGV